MNTTLVIGSKTYSSWSLRPWLLLRHFGVSFTERQILFSDADWREQIQALSPNGRVPLLDDDGVTIWESLAICEYAAERWKLQDAWPEDRAARAHARAIANEMHADFADLRRDYPFDLRRAPAPKSHAEQTATDVARIAALWREARSRFGGVEPWLFGNFSVADAMYAPVALRFHSYAVDLGSVERQYVQTVLAHPSIRDWIAAAALEPLAENH